MYAAPLMSLKAVFEKACPQYIAMGMTYEQFWDGDVSAHKMYREAKRQRLIDQNQMAWLQGMYIYEAMLDVGRYVKAFSKAKPKPYREEPYDLFEAERKEKEERKQRERYFRMRDKLASFAKAYNEKRQESVIEEVDSNA